jgi:thioredoxin 1
LPAIVDFYTDWCGPCRMVGPVLEKLAEEYAGRVAIYKVNTEKEPEVAGVFQIMSVPSLLFIPKEGKPQLAVGALTHDLFVRAIDDVLLNPPKEAPVETAAAQEARP